MTRLGFDIDGVVALTENKILSYLKSKYSGANELTVENDFYIYNLETSPRILEVCGKEVVPDLLKQYNDMAFYKDCPPNVDGIKVLRELYKKGYKLYFISNRPSGGEIETAKWFRKHNVPFHEIHHTNNRFNKGMYCRLLNLDFFLDDHTQEIENVLLHKNRWKYGIYLLDKPWNSGYINDKVKRIFNWSDVFRFI